VLAVLGPAWFWRRPPNRRRSPDPVKARTLAKAGPQPAIVSQNRQRGGQRPFRGSFLAAAAAPSPPGSQPKNGENKRYKALARKRAGRARNRQAGESDLAAAPALQVAFFGRVGGRWVSRVWLSIALLGGEEDGFCINRFLGHGCTRLQAGQRGQPGISDLRAWRWPRH